MSSRLIPESRGWMKKPSRVARPERMPWFKRAGSGRARTTALRREYIGGAGALCTRNTIETIARAVHPGQTTPGKKRRRRLPGPARFALEGSLFRLRACGPRTLSHCARASRSCGRRISQDFGLQRHVTDRRRAPVTARAGTGQPDAGVDEIGAVFREPQALSLMRREKLLVEDLEDSNCRAGPRSRANVPPAPGMPGTAPRSKARTFN